MKKRYTDAVPSGSPWFHQACGFVKDWLVELKKIYKSKRIQHKIGRAYQKTMRNWLQWYGDDDMSFIGTRAQMIMAEIKRQNPQLNALR